ncbi:uncharacterized protein LOC115753360 [Rhodamnia argentea]|uniref:Uncharacterized protein LOC115753360 n=1 Tax=Rhodamnia argentea TaxID=178133 RepID=A0A8B8QKS9_9MYRT|nr:uncharacterized protein LOC115753360 [Rhodamnia argentea]
MPAQTQTHDSEEDDCSSSKPLPMPSIRAREMKSPLNRGEELIKAIIEREKNAKVNASSKEHSKPAAPSSNRTCICSPTSHAGSFRCHLHRENQATKSSSANVEQPNSTETKFGRRHCSFGSPHLLSRFGRSSTTKSFM